MGQRRDVERHLRLFAAGGLSGVQTHLHFLGRNGRGQCTSTKVGVGLPAAVPEPLLTLPAPVSSSPAFLVAASAPPDYTPVGVTRVEETGARGETLWACNDLLESSMPGGLPKN